jgi:hypothetical protein|tara:strand:- start:1409 stop:1834 length:426 start_codon:yes stop_codon:yes gene_type:complete
MANKVRQVVNTIKRDYFEGDIKNERIEQYHRELKEATDHYEQEKEKSEAQKTHERYRRKQKSTESGMSLEDLIKPAKKIVEKPGTYFHGPLKKLAEEFGDIKTMTAYMTMGQITKYSEKDRRLYDRAGKLVYNEETQECFE